MLVCAGDHVYTHMHVCMCTHVYVITILMQLLFLSVVNFNESLWPVVAHLYLKHTDKPHTENSDLRLFHLENSPWASAWFP